MTMAAAAIGPMYGIVIRSLHFSLEAAQDMIKSVMVCSDEMIAFISPQTLDDTTLSTASLRFSGGFFHLYHTLIALTSAGQCTRRIASPTCRYYVKRLQSKKSIIKVMLIGEPEYLPNQFRLIGQEFHTQKDRYFTAVESESYGNSKIWQSDQKRNAVNNVWAVHALLIAICHYEIGTIMGLYRYLRRKLNIQQLKLICEQTQIKTDQCVNEMCVMGGGDPVKT